MVKITIGILSYLLGISSFFINESMIILYVLFLISYISISHIGNETIRQKYILTPLVLSLITSILVFVLHGYEFFDYMPYSFILFYILMMVIRKKVHFVKEREGLRSTFYIKFIISIFLPVGIFMAMKLLIQAESLTTLIILLFCMLMVVYILEYRHTIIQHITMIFGQILIVVYLLSYIEGLHVIGKIIFLLNLIGFALIKIIKKEEG